MQYINERREDFEPFMEDDEKFDAYIARMGRDAEWGGHQELFAASQHYNCNIVVHQLAAPRFEIHAPVPSLARATLHMSYHGEMHYNSVRQADDFNTMVPPVPITLRTPSGGAAGGGVLGTADEPEESEVRQQEHHKPPNHPIPFPPSHRRTPTSARRASYAARRTPHAARRTPHAVRRTPHAAHRTPHTAHRTPRPPGGEVGGAELPRRDARADPFGAARCGGRRRGGDRAAH